jgi:hypothetical protein
MRLFARTSILRTEPEMDHIIGFNDNLQIQ